MNAEGFIDAVSGQAGRRRLIRQVAVFMLILSAAFAGSIEIGRADQMEVVHFPAADKSNFPIWGHLGRPHQTGRRPAVVLMHGCGGMQNSQLAWARMLTRQGYVTLIVDSFRPRSVVSACTVLKGSVSYAARAYDAYGALAYLRSRKDVDPDRIGIIGWSIGGVAVMNAVARSGVSTKFAHGFKAALAFYPYCLRNRSFDLPLLVMIGESDDWTPAAACRDLQADIEKRKLGLPLELVIYPGAHHAFDAEDLKFGFKIPGADGKLHQLLYDQPAHEDSKTRVSRFLRQHLSPG